MKEPDSSFLKRLESKIFPNHTLVRLKDSLVSLQELHPHSSVNLNFNKEDPNTGTLSLFFPLKPLSAYDLGTFLYHFYQSENFTIENITPYSIYLQKHQHLYEVIYSTSSIKTSIQVSKLNFTPDLIINNLFAA